MLYKLGSTNGTFDRLELVAFKDFSSFGSSEKDLENLIANSILNVLFRDAGLMPIFQERSFQPEADIYALNDQGELFIFELKRSGVEKSAVHQVLRYSEVAGQWSYSTLEKKYQQYTDDPSTLTEAHKEAFNLEHPLESREINTKQHLVVIGSAADDSLINAVDYWKRQGVSIEFLPYRIYEFGKDKYFEFFALPYDRHKNPGDMKGVIFDTNRSWNQDSIWYMMQNDRVAAFGDRKYFIKRINIDDIVFFSHVDTGIVAAAKVESEKKEDGTETWYRDVRFITPVPRENENIRAMPFRQVSEITGKRFYWASTIKTPYLSKSEAENLAHELKNYLDG